MICNYLLNEELKNPRILKITGNYSNISHLWKRKESSSKVPAGRGYVSYQQNIFSASLGCVEITFSNLLPGMYP